MALTNEEMLDLIVDDDTVALVNANLTGSATKADVVATVLQLYGPAKELGDLANEIARRVRIDVENMQSTLAKMQEANAVKPGMFSAAELAAYTDAISGIETALGLEGAQS
jgi:hypothetical protein